MVYIRIYVHISKHTYVGNGSSKDHIPSTPGGLYADIAVP